MQTATGQGAEAGGQAELVQAELQWSSHTPLGPGLRQMDTTKILCAP